MWRALGHLCRFMNHVWFRPEQTRNLLSKGLLMLLRHPWQHTLSRILDSSPGPDTLVDQLSTECLARVLIIQRRRYAGLANNHLPGPRLYDNNSWRLGRPCVRNTVLSSQTCLYLKRDSKITWEGFLPLSSLMNQTVNSIFQCNNKTVRECHIILSGLIYGGFLLEAM